MTPPIGWVTGGWQGQYYLPIATAHNTDNFLLNLRQFSVEVLYSDEMYHFPNTMYHFKITALPQ